MHSTPRTSTESSIAISSRQTSRCVQTARSRCWTSAWRKRSSPSLAPAHVSQSADDHESGDDAAGHGAGHSGLHESRTSEGAPGRQAQRCVGVWLRALRDARPGSARSRAPRSRTRWPRFCAPSPTGRRSPRRCRSRSPRCSNAAWRRTTNGACAISATRGSSSMTRRVAARRGPRRRQRLRERARLVLADGRGGPLACVLALVAALAAWATRATPAPAEVRLNIDTPGVSDPSDLASLAVSPDGLNVAFVAAVDGQPHVWVRPLDSVISRPLPGTAGASLPFWSAGQPFRGVLCGRFSSSASISRAGWCAVGESASSGSVARGIATARFSWSRRRPVQSFARRLMGRRRCRSHGSTANKPVTRSPTFCPMAVISSTSCKGLPRFVASTGRARWAGDTKAVRCGLRGGLHLWARALRPSGTLFAQPFDVSRLEPSGDSVSGRGRCEWQLSWRACPHRPEECSRSAGISQRGKAVRLARSIGKRDRNGWRR